MKLPMAISELYVRGGIGVFDADRAVCPVHKFRILVARTRLPAGGGVAHVDEFGNAARHIYRHRVAQALHGGHAALCKIVVHESIQIGIVIKTERRAAVDENARFPFVVFQEGNGVFAVLPPVERNAFSRIEKRFVAAVGNNQADGGFIRVRLRQFDDEHFHRLCIGGIDQPDAERLVFVSSLSRDRSIVKLFAGSCCKMPTSYPSSAVL